MEDNNKSGKAVNFLQKLYNFRVKVDRKGQPIVNISSIFGAACLIFAPHMTIIGLAAAFLLGYRIHFEAENDDGQIEERLRKAADNIKSGAVNAAKSIQKEIDRARANNTAPAAETRPQQAAAQPEGNIPSNEELLRDLAAHAEEKVSESNPAATTFHSAYAASAGSVPILEVKEETGNQPDPSAPAARNME